jgi:hypothetical protein
MPVDPSSAAVVVAVDASGGISGGRASERSWIVRERARTRFMHAASSTGVGAAATSKEVKIQDSVSGARVRSQKAAMYVDGKVVVVDGKLAKMRADGEVLWCRWNWRRRTRGSEAGRSGARRFSNV